MCTLLGMYIFYCYILSIHYKNTQNWKNYSKIYTKSIKQRCSCCTHIHSLFLYCICPISPSSSLCLSTSASSLLSHPHIFCENVHTCQLSSERQSHWVNCPSFTADGCWQYVNASVRVWYTVRRGRFCQWFYFSWLIVNGSSCN